MANRRGDAAHQAVLHHPGDPADQHHQLPRASTSIVIEFDLDRDIDQAAADVQAAIARTQRQLPIEMTTPPSYRKLNPADAPILLLALTSDTTPLPKLDAFAQQVISPALSTIDGVGQVQVFGSQQYAVRIQLDPDALAARGIGVDEIQDAVASANANTPVGTVQGDAQNLTIEARHAARRCGRPSATSSSPPATTTRSAWATSRG